MERFIYFNMSTSKQKPNTVKNKEVACPFCDKQSLKKENNILKEEDSKLLIKNKYPTLKNAFQTVFIENDTCDENLSNYSKEKLYDVLAFGLRHWIEIENTNEFSSVVFFKNHGAFSGASIHHPHMQIVGLKDIDYRKELDPVFFEGIHIDKNHDVTWNISTKPTSEFYEINIAMPKKDANVLFENKRSVTFQTFCAYIQSTIDYILSSLCASSQSFNIAFYDYHDQIIAKVFPRSFKSGTVNSVYFLGFNLAQVPSDLDKIAQDLKQHHNLKK